MVQFKVSDEIVSGTKAVILETKHCPSESLIFPGSLSMGRAWRLGPWAIQAEAAGWKNRERARESRLKWRWEVVL